MAGIPCVSQALTKQTTKHITYALLVALVLLFHTSDCRICTRLTMEKKTTVERHVEQCMQSYKASCGWFSSEECTFYEQVECVKEENKTKTVYRIVEECCPGYQRNNEGKCAPMSQIDPRPAGRLPGAGKSPAIPMATQESAESGPPAMGTRPRSHERNGGDGNGRSQGGSGAAESKYGDYDADDQDDGKFFLGLSHGAYAGIVCGVLFIACVALLTALHYRKRRRRQKKLNNRNMEQEVAQQQQMLPLQKIDTEPLPT